MSDNNEEVQSRDVDEDEIPDSQVPDTELQSSCETFMSQQSENEELSEKQEQENKVVEVSDSKSVETSVVNSSMEANTSGEDPGSSFVVKTSTLQNSEKPSLEEKLPVTEEGHHSQNEGDIFEEKEDKDDNDFKTEETRKRKGTSADLNPSPKRRRKETPLLCTPEQKCSPELICEEPIVKQEVSVMEISSTPERTIILDDSQEFSLRIEDTSPPITLSSGEISEITQKNSQDKNSWESHKGKMASPAALTASLPTNSVSSPTLTVPTISLSQNAASWSSHTNEHNLSWGSHKASDDNKTTKKENVEYVNQHGSPGKDSSSDSLKVDSAHVRRVTEVRPGLVATIMWFIDNNDKVIAAEVKQLSLPEEQPVDKPGRMSSVSSTSAKSSSSAGSVGLPGPYPLPGKSCARLSTVSTVSSTTSSSSASNQAWDGPFLKPQVPGSKLNVTFSCEKCGHHFPPVDHLTSLNLLVNGSSPIAEEEEESRRKSLTPRRVRKQTSQSSSAVSSGPLEDETSSSGSQPPPQASSTPAKLPKGRPRKQQNGTSHRSAQKVSKGEEGSSTNARTPRSAGRRNGTSQSSAKKPEKGEGEPVLARWGGDGRYYPGWVAEPLTASQVLVRFCDGQSKPTAVSKIVKASIITPGTLVLAATRSGDYEEALVVQVDLSGPEPVYKVERDKTQREVQFPSIALQQVTVTELTLSEAQKVAAATNFNDLSLENIIAHPRKRSARTPIELGNGRKKKRQTTPQPCTSHGQTYSGPEENYGDTDSSTHSTCSLDLRGKETKPLDVECFPPESPLTKLLYKRDNMAYKKKEGKLDSTSDVMEKELGPIPVPGSKLFTDCAFLITYTDEVTLFKPKRMLSSIDESSEDELKCALWRERLRKQIINGGGRVYNSFSKVPKEELPNTYLITDKHCNTPLYLQCVVNNIPIYSNSVVIQCCAQNRPWKEVISGRGVKRMLAGYSLSRRCLVNPRSLIPLRGRTLLLALSGDSSLSTFWQTLITKVGGAVDLRPQGSLREKYDVVVTDTDCDRELVAEACDQGVPLVSMTWLQQVIITGEWRSPTEHPLYKYNTSGEGESPEY